MGLREWSVGGVLLSPFLIYVLLALLVTGGLRLLLRLTRSAAGSGTKRYSIAPCTSVY